MARRTVQDVLRESDCSIRLRSRIIEGLTASETTARP